MPRNPIGIDISKDRLDVFDPRLGRARAHANSAAGIEALLQACGPEAILVFEATSGCDRRLLDACARAGRPFVRLNPLHAWRFAQSLNLPKTDRTDARMLARFGAERTPAPHAPRDPDRAALAELADRRDQLIPARSDRNSGAAAPAPRKCESWPTSEGRAPRKRLSSPWPHGF